jgi:hypothetical protein
MARTFIAVVLIVTAACTGFLAAQIRYLPDAAGRWKPWKFVAYDDNRRAAAATPADLRGLETQLVALNAILKQTAGFAAPVGFSVETVGSIDTESHRPGQPPLAKLPLPGTLNFGAYGVHEWDQGGKTMRDDTGETAQLLFFVNQLAMPISFDNNPIPEFENLETDVALLPGSHPDMFGMSRYGATLVLKKNPAPLWTAVSLEETLTLATKAVGSRLTASQETAARVQKQYDDARDPTKRAQRLAQYKSTAALVKDPAYFDKMVKADQEIETSLAKMVGPTSDSGKAVIAAEREVIAAKAALAALSAADRVAPACYARERATALARFRRDPDGTCIAIVRPNWKLFNPALSRSAPQVLVIGHFERCLNSTQPASNQGGCTANRKLLEAIDKRALLAWLQ